MNRELAGVADFPGLPCVHCGLCLDTCPTYRLRGNEAESPRGRIYIMEAITRDALPMDAESSAHLDSCLGCLACETACPSGVSFGERIEAFRPRVAARGVSGIWRRWVRQITSSRPLLQSGLLAAAALDRCGARRLRRRLPGLGILPGRGARLFRKPRGSGARGTIRPPQPPEARVALLYGCVADTLRPSIAAAAEDVLHRNGVAVVDAPDQHCCGALALHGGREEDARRCARDATLAFTRAGVDRVVTTAAGCGAMMKSYGRLLAGDELATAAARIGEITVDIHEWLVQCGIDPPRRPLSVPGLVYHDACHLLHGQKIADQPRLVIEAATGVIPPDLGENSICCGSAGSYNLDRPGDGVHIGRRKAELAQAAGARLIAVGNIGCMLQLERAGDLLGHPIRAIHPIELLAEAYRRETSRRLLR